MLYYLFQYLESEYQFPGATLFQFITFRAAMAIIVSLLISTIYGKRIIIFLQKKQMGESIRELGLEGQAEKAGTPTMGGIIIILATLVPALGLGLLIGCTMYFHDDITIKEEKIGADIEQVVSIEGEEQSDFNPAIKSTKTTLPFIKNNEFDYLLSLCSHWHSLPGYQETLFFLIISM